MLMPRSFRRVGDKRAAHPDRSSELAPIRVAVQPAPISGDGPWQALKVQQFEALDPRVGFVCSLLERRYHEPLTVSQLAAEVRLTPRRLRMLFFRDLGVNVKELILEFRLQAALKLLEEGFLRISEVAYKVGFENAAHFSRAFKQRFGLCPSEIRKWPPRSPESAGPRGQAKPDSELVAV